MTLRSLPLAPRPYAGEALSSWVRRIAARYDIRADDLLTHVLDWRRSTVGAASRLDYQADPELEAALAAAARVAPATISHLRAAGGVGSSACWQRTIVAWCPECIRTDLAQRGEVYERAIWRLGCCVVCPEHKVQLEDTCRRCSFDDRCHFECADGLLRLVCNSCTRPVDPARRPKRGWWDDGRAGAFGACASPLLTRLVGTLQTDLQAALAGSRPRRAWGFVRSAEGLVTAVLDLTLCLVFATGVRCEPRIIVPEWRPGEPFAPAREPITPAALSAYAGYGVLAIAAAALRSLEGRGQRHHWRPDGDKVRMDMSSFVAWLPAGIRRWLGSRSATWEPPAGDAVRTVIAAVERAG
ncbi:MAG: hypothetical protein HIU82_14900 [Proteobacteria bacterium]|nr:hypothetical protein [Pseudomonadota bacterium]